MSGIFGLSNQDAAPVRAEELADMASLLERRGPDRTGMWRQGATGLGHTLLATTPESVFEQLPLKHAESGCVITADVRLDNRPELLNGLGILERSAAMGDAEIILLAYLDWGEACVERLLGDFAFAIWDPAKRKLFCARDHFGMRPFYYHHTPGRFLAFASEPRALLVLPQTPYHINEGRIADFLVSQLEGIDKTSTFFEEVYRLPPAHTLTLTRDSMELRRYWRLDPGPELRLPSDEAYAEAFLEVFTEAVRCRLRSAGPVGSMLSGGMDSGSVVAVARGLLAKQGRGPLPTFSAVAPNPAACVETSTIHAALTMEGLDPHLVSQDQLDALMPELGELSWDLEEPFDNHMTLIGAIYLAAHRRGLKVLLDGVGGDVVLAEGSHLARLLRQGRWLTAWREAVGQNLFWGGHYPAWREMYRSARSALATGSLRRLRNQALGRRRAHQQVQRSIRDSIISPRFAARIVLAERLQLLARHGPGGLSDSYVIERAQAIDHPYLTVGRERYDRVASAVSVEPRDPFLDRRVATFCVRLPGNQKVEGGWPKVILRRAMAGRLPGEVRWRRGKEHLGWSFTNALMSQTRPCIQGGLEANWSYVSPYVEVAHAQRMLEDYFSKDNLAQAEEVYDLAHLAAWLSRRSSRPRAIESIHPHSFPFADMENCRDRSSERQENACTTIRASPL